MVKSTCEPGSPSTQRIKRIPAARIARCNASSSPSSSSTQQRKLIIEEPEQRLQLHSLPANILNLILIHLHSQDVLSTMLTCKRIQVKITNEGTLAIQLLALRTFCLSSKLNTLSSYADDAQYLSSRALTNRIVASTMSAPKTLSFLKECSLIESALLA